MPTSANQQSKPKNTICFHKLPDVRQVPTSVSGQRTPVAAGSGQGLTPPGPDQIKLGPQTRALDSESSQSNKADQIEEEIKTMARFGPTYWDETVLPSGQAKDCAWEKTKEKDGEDQIMKAIKSIEKEAMECYESSIVKKLKQRKMFRMMMAKDGCFFLHLAIHILGGGELLSYPDQNPYFGKGIDTSSWIPEMFFVGNQIPCIVINALMKLSFFQDVIKEGIKKGKGKWKPPPVEHLAELALYQTIVEPHLKTETEKLEKEKKEKEKLEKEKKEKDKEKETETEKLEKEKEKEKETETEKLEKEKEKLEKEKEKETETEKLEKEKTETEKLEKDKKDKAKEKDKKDKAKEKDKDIVSFQRKPSEILEALRNLHLGPGSDNDPIYTEMKDFQDLEAGMDGKDNSIPGKDNSIPGAGDLDKKGIKLVKGKAGITKIRFINRGYAAFLYVPPFTVDKHTKKLLTSLANWELLHLNESERELTSYLRFMRDLARTYKDFKILEGKGIICVKDDKLKRTVVQMLDTIVSGHNSNYTLNFRQIRRDIKDYGGPPWRLISFCLGVLTVVQTIFTVLSYCFPPRT